MSRVQQISSSAYALHTDDGAVYTLSNRGGDNNEMALWQIRDRNWEHIPTHVGEFEVVPYGWDNNLPAKLRDALDANNLAPGVLRRQMGLIYGQGLHLFRTVTENGEVVKQWDDDPEIMKWLTDWDSKAYIEKSLDEYLHLGGVFSLLIQKRSRRLGKPFVQSLECVEGKNARLEWVDTGNLADVKSLFVGDFEHSCIYSGVQQYPIFNPAAPETEGIWAMYAKTASFGRSFYALPQYWGALRWISRGSDIPSIFKYVTDNSLNMAYHIHSPKAYWDAKREMIRLLHPDMDPVKIEEAISELTSQLLKNLTGVLSGKENAGKFYHTVDVPDDSGNIVSWKIEPIDQKIKEFVEAQLKIHDASISAITSGMGLYPALSNVLSQGKLSSGSDLMNAFQLFRLADTEIPQNTVLKALNQAIAINFPGKGLRAGFYYTKLGTQSETAPADRLINQ